jgi:hypothetical protein
MAGVSTWGEAAWSQAVVDSAELRLEVEVEED